MEHVTQATASNAEQSAAAANQLKSQSQTMREIASALGAMVGGIDKEYSDLSNLIRQIRSNRDCPRKQSRPSTRNTQPARIPDRRRRDTPQPFISSRRSTDRRTFSSVLA